MGRTPTDYIGESNRYISDEYDGWIDLFGWGKTTLKDPDNRKYDYFSDWTYNISNGSGRNWRSLERGEYYHILFERETNSGIRFAKAQVNGVNGVILLPDNWVKSTYSIINANVEDANCASNIISSDVWNNTFEANGAVFLPTAGRREYYFSTPGSKEQESVNNYQSGNGFYWVYPFRRDSQYPDYLYFSNTIIEIKDTSNRRTGMSVRLVCPVDK